MALDTVTIDKLMRVGRREPVLLALLPGGDAADRGYSCIAVPTASEDACRLLTSLRHRVFCYEAVHLGREKQR